MPSIDTVTTPSSQGPWSSSFGAGELASVGFPGRYDLLGEVGGGGLDAGAEAADGGIVGEAVLFF